MTSKTIFHIGLIVFIIFISGWFFHVEPFANKENLYFLRYSENYIKVIVFFIASFPLYLIFLKHGSKFFTRTTELRIGDIVFTPLKKILLLCSTMVVCLSISDLFLNVLHSINKRSKTQGIRSHHYNFGYSNQQYSKLLEDIEKGRLKENTFNVFILGESTLESLSLDFFHEEFKNKNILNKINLYNLSVAWASTAESLIKISNTIINANPSLIFIAHGAADILRGCNDPRWSVRAYEPDYGNYLGAKKDMFFESQTPWASKTIELIDNKIFKKWFSTFRPKNSHVLSTRPTETSSNDFFQSESSFKKNLSNLVELSKLLKAKPILISMPTLLKKRLNAEEKNIIKFRERSCVNKKFQIPSLGLTFNTFQRFHKIITETSQSKNINLIDFTKSIDSTLDNFNDFVHLSKKAKSIVSNQLAETILKEYSLFKRGVNAL